MTRNGGVSPQKGVINDPVFEESYPQADAGDSNSENTRGVLQPMEVTLHGLPMVCTVNTEKLKGMGIGVGVTE